jgi:hypothetical protein
MTAARFRARAAARAIAHRAGGEPRARAATGTER